MTTVERMARAMAENDSGPEGSALFDIHWREFGEGYKSSALAALKALREPSEGSALQKALERVPGGWGPGAWIAGIDAAISEAEGGS